MADVAFIVEKEIRKTLNRGKRDLPEWAPNPSRQACYICLKAFTLFFRRHHCRRCGNLVCNPCSKHRGFLMEFVSDYFPEMREDEQEPEDFKGVSYHTNKMRFCNNCKIQKDVEKRSLVSKTVRTRVLTLGANTLSIPISSKSNKKMKSLSIQKGKGSKKRGGSNSKSKSN
eukprot:TRINITY_DN8720_c0_g1_i2.p1 TRINITY_DN8720_c0_g1~~TRINITY_DN8720_c0_g1_i2.p1  ORF type:complete len:171 (-),score=27.79 TRINITY_DN8720_c0_g1_i2:35-547(-)